MKKWDFYVLESKKTFNIKNQLTAIGIPQFIFLFVVLCLLDSCSKTSTHDPLPPSPPFVTPLKLNTAKINGQAINAMQYNIDTAAIIKLSFSAPVDRNTTPGNISFYNSAGIAVPFITTFENSDSTIVLQSSLGFLIKYLVNTSPGVKSKQGGMLQSAVAISFVTKLDSTDKFPRISNNALLDLIQQQTFKYFWDFGHPVSGMARERNTSGETVTTGGTG
ncbi:MAG: Ig-like domain-containing protein, partial [Ginsengibacter sp.]